jgi:WD40 repeat protein
MHKTIQLVCLALFFAPASSWAQEKMTVERFREIVETKGDDKPLSSELANIPFWKKATARVTYINQDGTTVRDILEQSTKKIEGKYIVSTFHSLFQDKLQYGIYTYDEKASIYKFWGLSDEKLTEGITLFDFEKKIFSMRASYGEGIEDLSVGYFSEKEAVTKTQVYKNGVLYFTREIKSVRTDGDLPSEAKSQKLPAETNGEIQHASQRIAFLSKGVAEVPYLSPAKQSPDGKISLEVHKNIASLVDVATNKPIGKELDVGKDKGLMEDLPITCWSFSPDGKQIVLGAGFHAKVPDGNYNSVGKICVWDIATGKLLAEKVTGNIHSVCFSEDGKSIVIDAEVREIDGP